MSNNTGRSLEQLLNSQEIYTRNYNSGNNRDEYRIARGRGSGRGRGHGRRHRHDNNEEKVEKKVEEKVEKKVEKKVEENDITDIVQFPKLTITDISSNTASNSIDYTSIINNTSSVYNTSTEDVYPGWTLINKKTKEITTYDIRGRKVDLSCKTLNKTLGTRDDDCVEQIYNCYQVLSDNWCEYYDTQNELLGDRSPFINYKDEIDKLAREDEEIFSNLYQDLNNYSSSDDEFICMDD